MNLAELAKKLGQVRRGGPVRISVSDVSEILGEPARNALQSGSSWVASFRRSASGHMLDLEFADAKDGESHSAVLQRLVQQANTSVFEAAVTGGRTSAGMATTIVACAVRYDRVSVAHVGDSRCYLIRNGKAAQITRDHTFASEQVRLGLITAQEAAEGETSHILSRSLGTELVANIDTNDHQIFAGDVLLLCSDGLHGMVDASEMAATCGQGQDLHLAAENLVALANDRGGGDNISVQLIRIRGVERMGMYRGRPYKLY